VDGRVCDGFLAGRGCAFTGPFAVIVAFAFAVAVAFAIAIAFACAFAFAFACAFTFALLLYVYAYRVE
jgi:hypothetical protein